MISFFVPGKPQGKGRPRFTREGHTYTPDATKDYETRVKLAYKQAGGKKIDGAVSAFIHAYFAVPKSDPKKKREEKLSDVFTCTLKPDCDNIAKIILDALNGLAYDDDKQIAELVVCKSYCVSPGVSVSLAPVREFRKGEAHATD